MSVQASAWSLDNSVIHRYAYRSVLCDRCFACLPYYASVCASADLFYLCFVVCSSRRRRRRGGGMGAGGWCPLLLPFTLTIPISLSLLLSCYLSIDVVSVFSFVLSPFVRVVHIYIYLFWCQSTCASLPLSIHIDISTIYLHVSLCTLSLSHSCSRICCHFLSLSLSIYISLYI